ncbi:MAG TPA: hypothetical protein VD995_17650 [Azospirillum sp.]|nr:hypothetical protein [Azospirillum sp.]
MEHPDPAGQIAAFQGALQAIADPGDAFLTGLTLLILAGLLLWSVGKGRK